MSFQTDDQRQMPPTTADTLEEQISSIAVQCGIILNDGSVGFGPEAEAPPDLPGVAEEKGYAEAAWPWRRLMVECVNYLSIQSLVFQRLLRDELGEQTNFVRASLSLSTKAASDARCALHLCDHGYVVQASIVARSCVEAVEALTAFTLDGSSADTFVSAQTLEEAKFAWFLLLRHKPRQAMDDAFADIIEMDEATAEWRSHNRNLFGALTHPSYLAPMLNLFSDWEEGKEGHPLLPARTLNCVVVFQAVADSCFEYASLLLLTINGRRNADAGNVELTATDYKNAGFFEDEWLDSYASRGHKFFQLLWIFFLGHQDDVPFSLWREGKQLVEERETAGQ